MPLLVRGGKNARNGGAAAGYLDTVAVLFALVPFLTFFAVGFWARRWTFVASTVMLCLAIAAFLWLNDGWYGAGWGDFGVAYNVIAGVSMVVGVALGVAIGKATGHAHVSRSR